MHFLKKMGRRVRGYIFNPAIDIKQRSFVLFSVAVLISLFLAVICGLIMKEPVSATVSTFAGAVFFSIYVLWTVKRKKIDKAKIVISFLLVFVFLPVMFFTNGGALGGAPTWLLLGTIYIALILDGRFRTLMLLLNIIVTALCGLVGYLMPELVTEYSRGTNYFDAIAGLFIVGGVVFVLSTFQRSLVKKEEEHKNLMRLFEQTATSLVNAIDAKDRYTHGHSSRVAEYSKKIAELAGMSPEDCENIYYVALLHDVGKIGIPEHIINKEGKLTREEYEIMKQHSEIGNQILSGISEYPYLSIGAHYHHERYDGKGYPDKLKGEDIPEIARIISVADAYDAMTSERSYRETIPQQAVREEIVKGSGTQFDPKYAKIMQHLIDMDTEYRMREKGEVKELSGKTDLVCKTFRDETSDGIFLTPEIRKIRFKCSSVDTRKDFLPGFVVFDSLDGRYHDTAREMRELNYFEFGEVWADGRYVCTGARKIIMDEFASTRNAAKSDATDEISYEIEAVKRNDHVQIKIDDGIKSRTVIIALPDCSRFTYICLAGQNCHLYDVNILKINGEISETYIPRIAEKISYIDGPEGDVPNVQVDGYRTASTLGIPVTDGMKLTFHTKSLPTARLIWHTAYVVLFWSADKKPDGKFNREYALIRLDGEHWEAQNVAVNKMIVNMQDGFDGWDAWKEANKKGIDVTVTFKIEENRVTTFTENQGIVIKNTTTITDDKNEIFVSLTGDQCAITNIRVER